MIFQIVYYLAATVSLPFFPILLVLGNIAKKRTGKLPDAEGPSGRLSGIEPALKLAVIGESTVAGVGVENHEEGVAHQMAKYLNSKTKREIFWEAIGWSGFTAGRVNDYLADELNHRTSLPDIVVIMLGGNDTFELNSPLRWRKEMNKLVVSLRMKYQDAKIVIANLPPVDQFTSFHPLLQWYLGSLTNLHRRVIMDFPILHRNLIYMSEKIDFDKWRMEEGRDIPIGEFFSDGVHPSALTYRLWAKQIGERILKDATR